MISPRLRVGVDRGGSWIRVVALDAQNRTVRMQREFSPPLETLPSYLKKLWQKWHLVMPDLAIGSRGVWTPRERRVLRLPCETFCGQVKVVSDVEGAWLAAFRPLYDAGILVIAGTGSIGYSRDSQGHVVRAGGLGPLLGDEGSGFWIGREWLRAGAAPIPRGATAATVAAFARRVVAKAQRGHPLARHIVREAQQHLGHLVGELAQRWSARERIPVSYAGRLLEESYFRRGFMSAARAAARRTLVWVDPIQNTASALAASLPIPRT